MYTCTHTLGVHSPHIRTLVQHLYIISKGHKIITHALDTESLGTRLIVTYIEEEGGCIALLCLVVLVVFPEIEEGTFIR